MALLEARNLNKSFGSVTAAAKVSATIEENDVIGIIGANGAGKTTFVNMVTGYLKPDTGRITYQGRDITRLSPRRITQLGICRSFQVPQVFLSASAFENLMIALGVADGGARALLRPLRSPGRVEQADAILRRYQIADYRNHPAELLPQGVRKLLDIAMAVVHRPKLALLDEPTSGVAISEKFGIMDIVMGALADTGVTTLFVEHDMEIVARYARRVIAFYDGSIIADGSPARVLGDEQVRRYVIGEELHMPEPHGSGASHA